MKRILFIISILIVSFNIDAQTDAAKKGDKQVVLGNKAYDKGDVKAAAALYQKALDANPKNDAARINLAIAQGKLSQNDQSVSNFDAALNNKNNNAELNASLNYDKGVSLSKAKKYSDAIKSYENSLRINPGDQDARENLQKAINELKQQQQQQQKQQNQNKQNQQQKDKQQQQQNKDQQKQQQQNQMSKDQAEQLLKALREQEKETQKKLNEQKASGGIPQNGKDW